jgi:hypothetical protein
VEQEDFLVPPTPSRADAEVAQFGALVGRVPALEYHVEAGRLISGNIRAKPMSFHHAATEWRRSLLVLLGKVEFSHSALDVFENLQGFALWMERFPDVPANCPRTEKRLQNMDLLLFSNGGQAYMLPALLF